MCGAVEQIEQIYAAYAKGEQDAVATLEQLNEIAAAVNAAMTVVVARLSEHCCAEGLTLDAHAIPLSPGSTVTMET